MAGFSTLFPTIGRIASGLGNVASDVASEATGSGWSAPTIRPINQSQQQLIPPVVAAPFSAPAPAPTPASASAPIPTPAPATVAAPLPSSQQPLPQTANVAGQPQQQPGALFTGINSGIGGQYESVLKNVMSGRLFDVAGQGIQEAMARNEKTQRTALANQLSGAGLSGTGLGKQIASGLEGDLSQQRYGALAAIEQNKAAAQIQGMGEARQYAFENAQAQDAINQAQQENRAGFAAYAQTHIDLGKLAPEELMKDQGFVHSATQLWESYGGQGPVPPQWAANQLKAATDPRLNSAIVGTNYEIDKLVEAGVIDAEKAKLLKEGNINMMFGYFKRDENGDVVVDTEAAQASVTPLTDAQKAAKTMLGLTDTDAAKDSYTRIGTAITTGDYSKLIKSEVDLIAAGIKSGKITPNNIAKMNIPSVTANGSFDGRGGMKDVGGGNSVNTAFHEDDGSLRESAKAFFKPGALVTVNGKQYIVKGTVTDDPKALADYVQLTDVKTGATYNETFGTIINPPPPKVERKRRTRSDIGL